MNPIKSILIRRFKIVSLLTVSMTLSVVLLMLRIKLTHSFFYLFLVWNLFLALIPYAISTYLLSKDNLNKYSLALWFCIWLLFLPNSPYIITDLLHLRLSSVSIMWFDILVITSFAYNGLLLFFLSVLDIETILGRYMSPKKVFYFLIFLFILTAFGMYLGRFLRYNSWELLQHPLNLLNDIFTIIIQPIQHLKAWLFTFGFGTFLTIGFWTFKTLSYKNNME